MSMNLHIYAGVKSLRPFSFELIETPTKVSYEIYNSNNPLESYIDWVKTSSPDFEELDIYCDDNDPEIQTKINSDYSTEHVLQLKRWVRKMEIIGLPVWFRIM